MIQCIRSSSWTGYMLVKVRHDLPEVGFVKVPLTSIIFFFLLWKSMVPQNSLVTNFLQNIFLCVQQNKEINTGLELLEGE